MKLLLQLQSILEQVKKSPSRLPNHFLIFHINIMSSPFWVIKCCICEFIWPTHKVYCSHPFLTTSVSVTRLKHLVFSLETISNFQSKRELNGSFVQDRFYQCILMTAYIGRLLQHLVRQKNWDFVCYNTSYFSEHVDAVIYVKYQFFYLFFYD